MTGLALVPVVLSLLVLAAHFVRAGNPALVLVVLAVLGLLVVRRPWAARVVQAVLVLGAVEWVRTLADLAWERVQLGEPAGRLGAILGGVALATAASALVFRAAPVRRRYGLRRARPAPASQDRA